MTLRPLILLNVVHQDLQSTIHTAVVAALKSPEVKERLGAMSSTPVGNAPEAFGAFLKSEVESIARIVKALKLSAEGR